MKKKSHEMTSLQLFTLRRKQAQARRKNRKYRKAYSISLLEGVEINTYQCCIYLINCDTYAEAEKKAKDVIKLIRNRLGRIV